MILRPAPPAYDADDQAAMRDAIRRADGENVKRGRDIEMVAGRIILSSPDGSQWVLEVDNAGALSASAL